MPRNCDEAETWQGYKFIICPLYWLINNNMDNEIVVHIFSNTYAHIQFKYYF